VKELSEFPAFDLEKEGVTVKITTWTGDIQPIGELSHVWVTLKGIPPKWCAWETFGQLASLYGILMNVDWAALFKSLYAELKLLIACKDHTLIPPQRIVEMNQQLYMLFLSVSAPGGDADDGQDPDEPGQGGSNLVDAVTQHTTSCCSMQVVDITLAEHRSSSITSLRVVQQKHSGSKYKHSLIITNQSRADKEMLS
jgi:hypothetical protein